MEPTKAYILRIDDPISHEYAKTASDSCDKVGLSWEYFEGIKGAADAAPWDKAMCDTFGIKGKLPNHKGPASCATLGHFLIWEQIIAREECAVILEHDAIMLHKPAFDLADNVMAVLGYKVVDPHNYDQDSAGPPSKLEDRNKHGGAHAYAMNHVTAASLLKNVSNGQRINHIDNQFFLTATSRTGVKMVICDPICSLGWLRQSTIWGKSAVDNYGPILQSFTDHYKSKENLGVKK